MRQVVALLSLRTEAEGECKSDGPETERFDMVGEEEWRHPQLVSVLPSPFLKNTAPNAHREGTRDNDVLWCIRGGLRSESETAWTMVSGGGSGSGSGADGETPHVKLVDSLSGAIGEGSGVSVGKNGGNLQLLFAIIAIAN